MGRLLPFSSWLPFIPNSYLSIKLPDAYIHTQPLLTSIYNTVSIFPAPTPSTFLLLLQRRRARSITSSLLSTFFSWFLGRVKVTSIILRSLNLADFFIDASNGLYEQQLILQALTTEMCTARTQRGERKIGSMREGATYSQANS